MLIWKSKDTSPETQNIENNAARFQSAYSSQFWVVGVALSTRVGMVYTNGVRSVSSFYYNWIIELPKNTSERKEQRIKLLGENSLMIREYYNISQTNIIDTLKTSPDRKKTLESYIWQVELRSQNAVKSITNLEAQKKLYLSELNRIAASIENEKISLEKNFSSRNISGVIGTSDTYFSLRNDYTEYFTDIVFINQFLKQYQFLNDFNTGIINALKVNKQAIIDQTYVVIPSSGQEYLRPLELIFDETNFPN